MKENDNSTKITDNKKVLNNIKEDTINNKNQISILNYLDNPFIKKKIESPKSLKSMKNLNYKMNEIIYLTFDEFLNKYKEIKKLPEEIQKRKYEFYEEYRHIKIKNIKIERDRLYTSDSNNINLNNINNENNKREKVIKNLKKVENELEKEILLKKKDNKDKKDTKEKLSERLLKIKQKEEERKKKLEEENKQKQKEEYDKKKH